LTVDDEPVDEVIVVDGDGNWEFTPTAALALGDHTVSATQTVAGAVSGLSNENTFTVVDLTAPDAPVITQPVDGSTITDSTPDIVGTGEPDATVTVSIDGAEIGEAVVDEDGNWTVPVTTPLPDGPHTASAVQADEAGNESAADDVEFTLDDTVAPDAPVITAPAEGSTTNTTPDIVGTGEPGATVTVSIDGTEIGETTVDAEGNWTVPVTTPLAEGPHTASATQTDLAGNESAADDVDFVVDAEAVLITAPADGSIIPEPTPNIVGTGEPGATVVVSIDGAELGEATVDENGNWAVPVTTPLTDGPHIARAVQTDPDGNESTNEIEFAVDTVAPDAPVITGPADGSTTPDSTPDIVGTGEPNSTVTVFIDGVLIGEAVVDDDGNWTVPVTTPLANGPHSVSAVLSDGAGNESEVAFADFTVAAAAPGGEETDNENAVDNGPGSGGGDSLASTGGPAVGASILGILCLAAGGALVLIRSRRPGRSS
jgi:small neutral amino acid transporter SnatA (MarC family)